MSALLAGWIFVVVVKPRRWGWIAGRCIPVITLKMPDGKFPLIRVRLLNSYKAPSSAQPHLALIWQLQRRTSPPRCSRNNCFAITLAMPVVSCCNSVPFCQLKGYLDLLTVTKRLDRGQTVHGGVNRVLDAHFTHWPARAERALWFIKDRAVCHRHLLSDGYTKAWILGSATCFTAELEDWM